MKLEWVRILLEPEESEIEQEERSPRIELESEALLIHYLCEMWFPNPAANYPKTACDWEVVELKPD